MADLTQGRDPLDRLTKPEDTRPAPRPPDPAGPQPAAADPAQPNPDACFGRDADDDADDFDDPDDPASDDPARHSQPGPLPALINLVVPVGTLLGWSAAPAEAGTFGLLDGDETRTIVNATARHPRTRWCATLTAPDGTALAHACARGQHAGVLEDLEPQPPPTHLAELLRRLSLTFTPITRGCRDDPDPGTRLNTGPGPDTGSGSDTEEHYAPSRKLRHLVRARAATCDAPGCQTLALNTDLDHTIPWPDGPTSQSNLAPRCRTHHRAKQAPDWKVEQAAPGVTRWTLPSGRTRTTTPTKYES
jgi:hypothetical protein